MIILRCLLPVITLVVTGCSTPKMAQGGAVEVKAASELPQPTVADLVAETRPAFIGPGDLLSVEVFGLPELSREVRVDASGMISLPLAGQVSTSGRTPPELVEIVQERLRANYVRQPQVTVGLVETVSQLVTLEGEVTRPGVYPIIGSTTLMRAVARAEGTSEFANAGNVAIFRKVNGQSMAALYDLGAIQRGVYEDPKVYSNDIIVVGESATRRLLPQILQGASALLTPLIYILQN